VDIGARPPDLRSETMDADAQVRARILEHYRSSDRSVAMVFIRRSDPAAHSRSSANSWLTEYHS
jgi:hypothetical protein